MVGVKEFVAPHDSPSDGVGKSLDLKESHRRPILEEKRNGNCLLIAAGAAPSRPSSFTRAARDAETLELGPPQRSATLRRWADVENSRRRSGTRFLTLVAKVHLTRTLSIAMQVHTTE